MPRPIDIPIRARDRTRRGVSSAVRNLERLENRLGTLQRITAGAFLFVGVSRGVRALSRATDEITEIRNQLRLVTDGEAELERTQRNVFQLAQDTRSEFTSTANLYARIARNSADLEASQRNILDVTRAVNQSFQISGAGTAESASAALQLGQALASGVLRGEELNSILENSPRLASAIADGLGVGVGQLREMGSQGKLVSRDVFQAILSQVGKINDEFGTTQATIGQQAVTLGNSVTQLASAFSEASGTGGLFRELLDQLRQIADEGTRALQAGSLRGGANPRNVREATIRREDATSEIAALEARRTDLQRQIEELRRRIDAGEDIANPSAVRRGRASRSQAELNALESQVEDTQATIEEQKALVENLEELVTLEGAEENLRSVRERRTTGRRGLRSTEAEEDAARALLESVKQVVEDQRQSTELRRQQLRDKQEESGLQELIDAIQPRRAGRGDARATDRAVDEGLAFVDNQDLVRQAQQAASDALQIQNAQQQAFAALADLNAFRTGEIRIAVDAGQFAEARDLLDTSQLGDEMRDFYDDFISEAQRNTEILRENISNAVEFGLMAGIRGGSRGFLEFFRNVVIQRITSLLSDALADALSNADTSGGGLGSLLLRGANFLFGGARQHGGPTQSGRVYLTGEDGPELFFPNKRGNVVPLSNSAKFKFSGARRKEKPTPDDLKTRRISANRTPSVKRMPQPDNYKVPVSTTIHRIKHMEEVGRTMQPAMLAERDNLPFAARRIREERDDQFNFLFGGARQHGGPTQSGRVYLTGEDGPELFFPNQRGNVLPPSTGTRNTPVSVSPTIYVRQDEGLTAEETAERVVGLIDSRLGQIDRLGLRT